ncbi:hypothetical protein BH10PSE18_BH10PSE18_15120 [soil metagenome]
MSFVFDIKTDAADVQRQVDELGKQGRFALQQTIRSMAYKVRAAEQAQMRKPSVFDRPTPFIINSVTVVDRAKSELRAEVGFRYPGGKAVPPDKVLAAEIAGGTRRSKRAEVALRRVGLLPDGYFMVPGRGIPATAIDAYGNIKGTFIGQLLSYFQARGEQGYSSNMTAKRKRTLAKFGRTAGGFKVINGVQYFVSFGKLRGGRDKHLAAGIWSRTGIHGVIVKPVIMFVRQPRYAMRFDFFGVGERVLREDFEPTFAANMARALETAR